MLRAGFSNQSNSCEGQSGINVSVQELNIGGIQFLAELGARHHDSFDAKEKILFSAEFKNLWRTKREYHSMSCVTDEGRKREVGIIAGILVARHLKTTDDLFDSRGSPQTGSMVAAAVQ